MTGSLLIVDDVGLNREVLANEFRDTYHILEAGNGREAIEKIKKHTDISAVLLDLLMPEMDGIDVLCELNAKGLISRIPVFVITAEKDADVLDKAFGLGAVDIITKPFNPDFTKKRVNNVVELYAHRNNLQKTVIEQNHKLESINLNLIEMLASVIEFRDCDSGEHVKRIHTLTKILMKKVSDMYAQYEMSGTQIIKIANASLLHDIGKISIQDAILNKPGRFTAEEFEIMKQHTTLGCKILETFPNILDKDIYDYAYDICRHHHERWDGRGYPDGLKGDEITIWSQVVSIVDVYDALVSPRVYKEPFDHETAVRMINEGQCGMFNPQLLAAFNEALPEILEVRRVGRDTPLSVKLTDFL